MRRIACFLNACLMSVLFLGLLVSGNIFISRAFADVTPVATGSCAQLSESLCGNSDTQKRKRSVFEVAGRCFPSELKAIPKSESGSKEHEAEFIAYLEGFEKRTRADWPQVEALFMSIKAATKASVRASTTLTQKTKANYVELLEKTHLILPSEHVRVGGTSEFKKTCGEYGLEDNGSFIRFADGKQFILLCPGRILAAMGSAEPCAKAKVSSDDLLYTLSHELGHSIGGNFARYDTRSESWKIREDPYFVEFSGCMKKRFSEFPQADYGEASADYWASQSMSVLLKDQGLSADASRLKISKAVSGLCGTQIGTRHLPGAVRIERLITAQKNIREQIGCGAQPVDTCSL